MKLGDKTVEPPQEVDKNHYKITRVEGRYQDLIDFRTVVIWEEEVKIPLETADDSLLEILDQVYSLVLITIAIIDLDLFHVHLIHILDDFY